MTFYALGLLDLLLVLFFTMRLVRLVITDDVGQWFFQDPLKGWLHKDKDWAEYRRLQYKVSQARLAGTEVVGDLQEPTPRPGWVHDLLSGSTCPYCIGFWIGGAVLLSATLVGIGGNDLDNLIWRFVAGVFSLNWIAAYIGVRAGDTGYAEEGE